MKQHLFIILLLSLFANYANADKLDLLEDSRVAIGKFSASKSPDGIYRIPSDSLSLIINELVVAEKNKTKYFLKVVLDGKVLYNEEVMNSMNSTESKHPNFNIERGKKYEVSWHDKTWNIILVEKSTQKESFDLVLFQDTVMLRGIVVSRNKETSNYIMQDTALCIKSLQLKVDSINGQDSLSIKCNSGLIYSEPFTGKINGLNLLLSSANYYEFIYRNHKWSIGKERSSHEMGIGMALLLLLIGVLLGLLTIFCIKLVKKWNKNSHRRTLNKLLSATSKEPIELYFYIVNNYDNAKLDLQKAKVLGNCDFADKVAVINRAKQILNLDDLQILLCLEPFKECVNAEDVFLIIKENLNDDSLKECIVQSGIFTDEVPKTQDDYLNQIANVLKIDNEVVASKEILGLLGKNTLEESVLTISDYKKISDIVNEKIDTKENTSVEDIDNALGKLVEYRSFYDQILKHEIFKNKESISYDNVRYYLDRYIQLTDSYTKITNKINQYFNREIDDNKILDYLDTIISEASFSMKEMIQSFACNKKTFVTKLMERIDSNVINKGNEKLTSSFLEVLNDIDVKEFWKLYKSECDAYVVKEILFDNKILNGLLTGQCANNDLLKAISVISQKCSERLVQPERDPIIAHDFDYRQVVDSINKYIRDFNFRINNIENEEQLYEYLAQKCSYDRDKDPAVMSKGKVQEILNNAFGFNIKDISLATIQKAIKICEDNYVKNILRQHVSISLLKDGDDYEKELDVLNNIITSLSSIFVAEGFLNDRDNIENLNSVITSVISDSKALRSIKDIKTTERTKANEITSQINKAIAKAKIIDLIDGYDKLEGESPSVAASFISKAISLYKSLETAKIINLAEDNDVIVETLSNEHNVYEDALLLINQHEGCSNLKDIPEIVRQELISKAKQKVGNNYIEDSILAKLDISQIIEKLLEGIDNARNHLTAIEEEETVVKEVIAEKYNELAPQEMILVNQCSLSDIFAKFESKYHQIRTNLEEETSKLQLQKNNLESELRSVGSEIYNTSQGYVNRVKMLTDKINIALESPFLIETNPSNKEKCKARVNKTTEKVKSVTTKLCSYKVDDSSLPLATFSDLRTIIINELNSNFNAFDNVARNYAYSILPFMTDKDNGFIYDRRAMFELYKSVESLLAMFGITLLLPSLFSVRESDGLFTQSSGGSDLNNICTASRSHKINIDSDNKENVILDIVSVGYMLDGETIKETKVII